METIHIYHTNDLHSHFKDWPRIANLLKERRQWHENIGDTVFIFDIGDHIDRWHPLTDATFGKSNVELLNNVQYDAVTIGNNEGITLPAEKLNVLYEEADFSVLVANLYNNDGSRPQWLKPFEIFSTKNNTKIGVIGLTTNFTMFYECLNWKITSPIIELKSQVNLLSEKVDIIILLSHLGLRIDEQIANEIPEIDLILGGHTHHILHEGKLINDTLLCGAGKFGDYVGHVEIKISDNEKTEIVKKAWLYDTNELPQLKGENQIITDLFMMGESLLQTEVTTLAQKYSKEMLIDILCESLHEWCDVDCAIVNSGLILNSLEKGVVTKFDLLQICPHPINPAILNVSGAELKNIITCTCDEKWGNFPMLGFGFRGKIIGKFVYTSLQFIDGEIYINDELLFDNRNYKLAVPDMFTFGKFFPEISQIEDKQYLLPHFLRDLLEWKFKNDKHVTN